MICTVETCARRSSCRGWCTMHYKRWKRTGDPTQTKITPKGTWSEVLAELLTIETDECIPWPGPLTSNGYGSISQNDRAVATHVAACTAAHGPCPVGMEAAHSCGQPACVNGRHLRWATPTENSADRWLHGRMTRVTPETWLQMQEWHETGVSISEIARRTGHGRHTVRNRLAHWPPHGWVKRANGRWECRIENC